MKKYFGDIFQSIWTVLVGMKITYLHLFTRSVHVAVPSAEMESSGTFADALV